MRTDQPMTQRPVGGNYHEPQWSDFRPTGSDETADSDPSRARTVAIYIEAHLAEKLSVDCLARVVAVSPGHFIRSFRRWFGTTTRQYIRLRRVEKAKQLMLESTRPLIEIAMICGMCDQSALTNVFRRTVG